LHIPLTRMRKLRRLKNIRKRVATLKVIEVFIEDLGDQEVIEVVVGTEVTAVASIRPVIRW
jgi:hypothetical protein